VAPLLSGIGSGEIKYTHFSILVHKERLLPIIAAVNIKGESFERIVREGSEPWGYSEQIDRKYQLDNTFYSKDDNTFDRGHLVRRIDPVWGETEEAARAEGETFRWVNCTPQHKKLNQKGGAWYQLEQNVMEHGVKGKVADISVFSGPILNPNDLPFIKPYRGRDVQIPVAFWKVIVWRKADGKLYSVGFLMSQLEWIKSKLKPAGTGIVLAEKGRKEQLPDDYFENLPFNENKTYQVRLSDIEKAAGIKFDWPSVNLPFLSARPKAVVAKKIRHVYPFAVYIQNKIAFRKEMKSSGALLAKKIANEGQKPLSNSKVRQFQASGLLGSIKQFDLTNIKL
jgi:endonuclease G